MTTRHNILVVDDDVEIRNLLRLILEDHYEVSEAENGAIGIELSLKSQPDLILLDLKMPVLSGLEVCKLLKSNPLTKDIPVIVLTANAETPNLVQSFDLGADDFMEKPFHTDELLARISSKLRRKAKLSKREFADISMNIDAMEVLIGDRRENFSTLEFNLLRYFVENKNKVISREEILAKVWNDVCVSDRTVDAHIVSLRKKIQDSHCRLRTIYGAGYKLADSEEINSSLSLS